MTSFLLFALHIMTSFLLCNLTVSFFFTQGTACDECKAVVTKIHAYLADNITEVSVICFCFDIY